MGCTRRTGIAIFISTGDRVVAAFHAGSEVLMPVTRTRRVAHRATATVHLPSGGIGKGLGGNGSGGGTGSGGVGGSGGVFGP
jgi:hypothetical protein